MTMPSKQARAAAVRFQREQHSKRFRRDADNIEITVRMLAIQIDDLGTLGETIGVQPKTLGPDAYACFASNSLQGVLALLRDLRRATKLPAARKRGRR